MPTFYKPKHGGEYYVKRFDGLTHLVVMLYTVIMRFDSLREIMPSIQAEAKPSSFLQYPVQGVAAIIVTAKKKEVYFHGTWNNKIPLNQI